MLFEDKVRNFLKQHQPGLAYLAPKIAKQFYHNQSDVMVHLKNRFVKGQPSTYDPSKALHTKVAPQLEEVAATVESGAEQIVEQVGDGAAQVTEAAEGIVADATDAVSDVAETVKKKKKRFGKKKKEAE